MSTRQFLEFTLSDQVFGIDIEKVQEVTNPIEATPLPEVASFIKGVAVFRGNPIGVLDLRERFQIVPEGKGRLVVLKPDKDSLAIVVETVVGIRVIDEEKLRAPDGVYRGIKTKFIDALYEIGDRVVVVLKIEELLNSQEKIKLRRAIRGVDRSR